MNGGEIMAESCARDPAFYLIIIFFFRFCYCCLVRIWINLAQFFNFQPSFIFSVSFSQIIQYLQNKIKLNKNLTIAIIPSIN